MNENPFTEKDKPRLNTQREDVRRLMLDGEFRTLADIEAATGHPQASISARLRDLRRPEYGGYTVNRIHKAEACGTWYYQVIEPGFLFSTKPHAEITAHV